jgi:membrane protein
VPIGNINIAKFFSPRLPLAVSNFKITRILIQTFRGWWNRDAFSQSAAAAYCAIFSLPGFLIVIMTIAVTAFERQRVESQILSHVRHILGLDAAETLKSVIENSQSVSHDIIPMLIGGATLLFGATGLFVQLQKSLNNVWEVKVKKSANFLTFLKDRMTAFGVMISLGFLLMISLTLTAMLTTLSDWLARQFSDYFVYLFFSLNFFLSLVTVSFLFALMYKVLPDVHMKWRDALRGGVLAALLFSLGEYALTIYFQVARPDSTFGAAGSIILFLIWIYYSCCVLFFGAEFIRSYMNTIKDEKPPPTKIAKRVPEKK